MLKAIVFDVDGTLVDSVDIHAKAWQEAMEHFGHKIPFEALRSQIGKGGDQLMPMFLDEAELKEIGDDLTQFRADLLKRKFMSQIKAFPGVRSLFETVKDSGQQAALASSAKSDELQHYKELTGIADLIDVETTADDAERSKPFPDIFDAALDRLGNPPKDTVLVVGDSPHDAEAAGNAGIKTIGVLCGGFPESDLREAGCIAIFKDPEDLRTHYGELNAILEEALRTPEASPAGAK